MTSEAEHARKIHRITRHIEEVRLMWEGRPEEPLINAVCENMTRFLVAVRDNGDVDINPLVMEVIGQWGLASNDAIEGLRLLGELRK